MAFPLPGYLPDDPRFSVPYGREMPWVVPPEAPLGSSPAKIDLPVGNPIPPTAVPTDVGVQEARQEGASEFSLSPPPYPPAPKVPREGV